MATCLTSGFVRSASPFHGDAGLAIDHEDEESLGIWGHRIGLHGPLRGEPLDERLVGREEHVIRGPLLDLLGRLGRRAEDRDDLNPMSLPESFGDQGSAA